MPALIAATAFMLALAGCATPGPLHVYSVAADAPSSVHDSSSNRITEVPTFLEAGDELTGFAYDPFTDHFFLRLAPGNKIRVLDRPARAIKREFVIDGAPLGPGGDLAVRPRDGHLFLLHGSRPSVIETTRLGKVVRTFELLEAGGIPAGIAFDPQRNRLLVLGENGRSVTIHELDGRRTGGTTLERAAGPSFAFAAEARELYAPLRDRGGELGVFGEAGRLVRTVPGRAAFVDVGPRSFIRVF